MTDPNQVGALLGQIPKAQGAGLPPVHLWSPEFCGDIDMRIARDGTWYYLGTPIGRKPMVKLFSSIIRRDGEQYFLVTPVEKVGIKVDDAPFVALALSVEGEGLEQRLIFTTQVDDQVCADAQHPINVLIDPATSQPAPYVRVRSNLDALIHRNVFYQLVELAVEHSIEDQPWLGVWSCGEFFPIDRLPQ